MWSFHQHELYTRLGYSLNFFLLLLSIGYTQKEHLLSLTFSSLSPSSPYLFLLHPLDLLGGSFFLSSFIAFLFTCPFLLCQLFLYLSPALYLSEWIKFSSWILFFLFLFLTFPAFLHKLYLPSFIYSPLPPFLLIQPHLVSWIQFLEKVSLFSLLFLLLPSLTYLVSLSIPRFTYNTLLYLGLSLLTFHNTQLFTLFFLHSLYFEGWRILSIWIECIGNRTQHLRVKSS
jgi:hypothetical protein